MVTQTGITKEPHPEFPELIYRYEGPKGVVGYSRTKKEAQRYLRIIRSRIKDNTEKYKFKL